MSATLVFGGTFDPVHVGHISLSCSLIELLGDADLVLVPCQNPVHRDEPAASAQQRYDMLKLAVNGVESLRVDDCELRRSGPSYTIDTLQEYRNKLGADASLIFVMGMDSWLSLPTWHCWQQICDIAHILVLPRASDENLPQGEPQTEQQLKSLEPAALQQWSRSRLTTSIELLAQTPFGHIFHAVLEEVNVSATGVRTKLLRDESPGSALNPQVQRYIEQHNLYKTVSTSPVGAAGSA